MKKVELKAPELKRLEHLFENLDNEIIEKAKSRFEKEYNNYKRILSKSNLIPKRQETKVRLAVFLYILMDELRKNGIFISPKSFLEKVYLTKTERKLFNYLFMKLSKENNKTIINILNGYFKDKEFLNKTLELYNLAYENDKLIVSRYLALLSYLNNKYRLKINISIIAKKFGVISSTIDILRSLYKKKYGYIT